MINWLTLINDTNWTSISSFSPEGLWETKIKNNTTRFWFVVLFPHLDCRSMRCFLWNRRHFLIYNETRFRFITELVVSSFTEEPALKTRSLWPGYICVTGGTQWIKPHQNNFSTRLLYKMCLYDVKLRFASSQLLQCWGLINIDEALGLTVTKSLHLCKQLARLGHKNTLDIGYENRVNMCDINKQGKTTEGHIYHVTIFHSMMHLLPQLRGWSAPFQD